MNKNITRFFITEGALGIVGSFMEKGLAMPALGAISGTTYGETEILNPAKYAAMQNEPLLSANDEVVIPVRNQVRPHFRRLGGSSFGSRLGRGESNPTHNKCVDDLFASLNSAVSVVLSVYVFNNTGQYHQQPIFSTLPGAKYAWFKEADARVGFCDGTYIQPDIGGRDTAKFFPRSSSPTILIEVVRTHSPELDTFKKLYELSLANTIVVFYFIADGQSFSKLNHLPTNPRAFEIRMSRYLLNGEVYINDKVVYQRGSLSLDAWYLHLSLKYFQAAQSMA
ncbi:hypothetical protein I5L59_01845 [Pseudomonas moraviensis]|uniref:hypothetical protein n=1 Tax=Pseudomonas moraviensis TaxID=321662 RepID=UPI0018D9FE54|nr:hypothetical protein [Pseudomonas moraviensis]MBH3442321.1 hypothetical protein [Pseudomonas moraviensis]